MKTLENSNIGEIILYQPDDSIRLEVRIEGETVWLRQSQMATLFQTSIPNVNIHIKNIFSECELEENSVIKNFLTTATDGKKYRTKHYNLDVIISVGYRIKSLRGTAFRRWATKVLKEYMLKGYAINQQLERVEQFAIETQQQLTETKIKLDFLTQYIESVLADYNDINEDTRMQLELINGALAELQTRSIRIDKPQNPMWN